MNLYIALDQNNRKWMERAVDDIQRRHQSFRNWCNGRDSVDALYGLIFPNNMPVVGYVSNKQKDNQNPQYAQMAIRLNPAGREQWPFPEGCTFIAIGSWHMKHPSPIFLIKGFIETANFPVRPFERKLTAFAVHDSLHPTIGHQRIQRENNILTPQLLDDLPPIAQQTEKQLTEWTDFLQWKDRFIRYKARGLRYVKREWRDEKLIFTIIAQDEKSLQKSRKALGRNNLVVFQVGQSKDPWVFSLPDKDIWNLPQLGQIGKLSKPILLPQGGNLFEGNGDKDDKSSQFPWSNPVLAELTVSLTEDDENRLANDENQSDLQARILNRFPESGFLSISIAGDCSLVRRHRQSLRQLQEQGGYAPYLADYLFDPTRISTPLAFETVEQWSNKELNPAQKEAVVKILSAPDLCLIQGPPGTGKTTVIAEAIVQLVRRGQRVLLASQAHTAVDNALDRLGHDSSLRVVRLARNENKITEDGAAFAGQASLERYYNALKENVESRLTVWNRTDQDLRILQNWYKRVGFVLRDEDELNTKRILLEEGLSKAYQQRLIVQQQIDNILEVQAEDHARRQRLQNIQSFFDEKTERLYGNLQDIESSAQFLAEALIECRVSGLNVKFSLDDWLSHAGSRGEMLAFMLGVWWRYRKEREAISADIGRLREATDDSLQDVATKLRIEAVRDEVKALEKRMEEDDTFVHAWREKRKKLKELEQTEIGLELTRYDGLFEQSEKWCSPIENAALLADEIASSLAILDGIQSHIEQSIKDINYDIQFQLSQPISVIPDKSLLYDAENAENAAQSELDNWSEQYKLHLQKVDELLWDEAVTKEGRLPLEPNVTLLERAKSVAQVIDVLKERQTNQYDERRVWEPLLKEWKQNLSRENVALEDWEYFGTEFLENCNVVAITCNENERTLDDSGQTSFDVAIIDEVSKATPLELLMPLMRARRAVLVGDHRQLPPLFQEGDEARSFMDELDENDTDSVDENNEDTSSEDGNLLSRDNLRRFEKMVTASLFKSHFEKVDDSIRARLNVQFRMHPQIMAMVNQFYENQLECGLESPDQQRAHGITLQSVNGGSPLLTPDDHVLWVDTTYNLNNEIHREDMDGNQPRRTNRLEAELIAEALEQIEQQSAIQGYSRSNKRKVGVVSFYANQCREIRAAIKRRRPKESNGRFSCLDVEVNTVIRYQGKEKSTVLVSMVRHDGYDPLRSGKKRHHRSSKANVARFEFINVAFSRAQELLIVFGAKSMYDSYEVSLPRMDNDGIVKRQVYKDILSQLERDARLVQARQLMSPDMVPNYQQKQNTFNTNVNRNHTKKMNSHNHGGLV